VEHKGCQVNFDDLAVKCKNLELENSLKGKSWDENFITLFHPISLAVGWELNLG
jgi:hypothetical protein